MDQLKQPPEALTTREQEILNLLSQGLADREIAYKLGLALSTIKWYNRQIYAKLEVNTRTQAIARARYGGLLTSASTPSSAPHHNLPAQTTQLIGRDQELLEAQQLLNQARLLTLTGAPGTGKTRLALQLAKQSAHHFADGLYFVSLGPLRDATRMIHTLAGVVRVEENVYEPLFETLKRSLHAQQILLLLDNFEHLLAEASVLAELLASAPQLKLLVTSRAVLNLYGEVEYVVKPLSLPVISDATTIPDLECDAVRLFVARAQAAKPEFTLNNQNALAIAKICVRLDGLPLAIELAAARSKLLGPQLLLERLSTRLTTLTSGSQDLPMRQQTLRNTIDWSYDLLSDPEKMLFTRLAVFAGGWSLEAAEQVCGADVAMTVLDGLTALLNKSLIYQADTPYGELRFSMLETLHEYAQEQFASSDEAEHIRQRHAEYFIQFVEQTGKALDTIGRSTGLSRLEWEQNNIRAVLQWSLATDPEPGLLLIAAVGLCWRIRSYMAEGFHWVQLLLEQGQHVAPLVRSQALSVTGTLLACQLGNIAEADRMSQEALDLALQSEDVYTLARAWFARSSALIEFDIAQAFTAINTAITLFQELTQPWELARALNLKGEILRAQGEYTAAREDYEAALTLFQQLGNPWGVNSALSNLAAVAQYQHCYADAQALLLEALQISLELHDKASIAVCFDGLAGVQSSMQQPTAAALLFGAAAALRSLIGAHIQAGDRTDYERNLATTQAQLDGATFDTYWNKGHALPLEQVLAFIMDA